MRLVRLRLNPSNVAIGRRPTLKPSNQGTCESRNHNLEARPNSTSNAAPLDDSDSPMLLVDFLQELPLPQLFVATLGCGVVVGAVVLVSVQLALRALGGGAAQVLPVQGSLITGV